MFGDMTHFFKEECSETISVSTSAVKELIGFKSQSKITA